VATHRTLLTFDKDFGELAYRRGLPADCGIVLFRITPQTPEEVAVLAVTAIKSQPTWAGSFSVVTRQRIRVRPLPAPPKNKPS
jgi:predicted nuclease of predicted toxin-antitoxin system